MPILAKGTDFSTGQQVTAANLDNLVDAATFDTGAVDNSTTQLSSGAIIVKDGGVTPAKLSSGAPSWNSSGDLTSTRDHTVTRNLSVTGTAAFTGTVSPAGLVDCSAAGAGQIRFPATQNASSNANTLDDYEEGTWTPTLGGTASYTEQSGRYTKIGRIVHVEGRLTVNSIGTGSTGVISGLPFTAAVNGGAAIGYFQNLNTTGYVSVYAHVVGGSTTIQTGGLASGGDGVTSPANFFKGGTDVIFSASYSV